MLRRLQDRGKVSLESQKAKQENPQCQHFTLPIAQRLFTDSKSQDGPSSVSHTALAHKGSSKRKMLKKMKELDVVLDEKQSENMTCQHRTESQGMCSVNVSPLSFPIINL